MFSGIIGISAKEIPSVGVAAPDHTLIPFPAVSAQPVEVFFHKLRRFVLVLKHRGKFLQQLCFTTFPPAFDLFKAFLELLQLFALFGLLSLSPPPIRAFRVWYRYPVATVIINLCREKVHLSPPASDTRRVTAIPFVLFSCKFLSSEDKICTKKRA